VIAASEGPNGVQLLCPAAPLLPGGRVLEAVSRFCPGVEVLPIDSKPSLTFRHPAHTWELQGQQLSALTFVGPVEPLSADELEPALGQAWDFPTAREAVSSASGALVVLDLMSSGISHRVRVDLLQRMVRGVLECVDCLAMRWLASDRIVDPRAWRDTYDAGDPAHLFTDGAVNVRLFNLTDAGGRPTATLMDTLGLAPLGLPDLQCHFNDLDLEAVARTLYNTAWYIFNEGDVIEDGHTIPGLEKGGPPWRCQHEEALVGPKRVVLDLDPGPPHAAGRRSR